MTSKYDLESIINWCFDNISDLENFNYKYSSYIDNYDSNGSLVLRFYNEEQLIKNVWFYFIKSGSKAYSYSKYIFILSDILAEIRLKKLNKIING